MKKAMSFKSFLSDEDIMSAPSDLQLHVYFLSQGVHLTARLMNSRLIFPVALLAFVSCSPLSRAAELLSASGEELHSKAT